MNAYNKLQFKSLLKRFLPLNIIVFLKQLKLRWYDYSLKSYSQEGEDMILRRIFETVETGFYVDIGAHHPRRFSNTYFFYKKGWSGINVDATPGSMKLFKQIRNKDINIEAAIAEEEKELTFFMFKEQALNTFDAELSIIRSNTQPIINQKKIYTVTLKKILSENLLKHQKIDFLTVDVEGYDLEVLKSNNWQLFRPEYILVECLELNMNKIHDNLIYNFLYQQDYIVFAKTLNTIIFKNQILN